MNVSFYTFSKKENSTARPTATVTPVAMQLKERCTVRSPLLESKDYHSENYCYIQAWDRYYYIREKTYINGAWTYRLECDYLATYKTEIGATSMFMLRSSTSFDGTLIDSMYPLQSTNIVYDYEFGTQKMFSQGVYVISVLGNNANNGGQVLYQMSPDDFQSILNELLLSADGLSWGDIPQGAKLSVMNPIQYITSCRWYPYPFNVLKDANDQDITVPIKAGLFTSTTQVNIVTGATTASVESYTITQTGLTGGFHKHPQSSTLGENLNLRPYSRYLMELGCFGCLELDTSLLANCTAIQVNIYADQWTGIGKARVLGRYTENGVQKYKLLASVEAKYGVDIPMSQSAGINFGDMVKTAIGAVSMGLGIGDALTGMTKAGFMLGMKGSVGASSGIASMEQSMTGVVTGTSSVGGLMNHGLKKHLYCIFNTRIVGDNTNNGRPLCQMNTPATIGGFMLVQKGVVPISASDEEMEIVNRTLESGFYYE